MACRGVEASAQANDGTRLAAPMHTTGRAAACIRGTAAALPVHRTAEDRTKPARYDLAVPTRAQSCRRQAGWWTLSCRMNNMALCSVLNWPSAASGSTHHLGPSLRILDCTIAARFAPVGPCVRYYGRVCCHHGGAVWRVATVLRGHCQLPAYAASRSIQEARQSGWCRPTSQEHCRQPCTP